MVKFMKWALALIVATCVATPPAQLAAQSGKPLLTADFRDYRLGDHNILSSNANKEMMNDVQSMLASDSTTEVDLVGYADATPWGSCGRNVRCSASKNLILANQRASSFARVVTRNYAINPSRIKTRGEVAESRGGQFRGVTLYIRHRETGTSVVLESSSSTDVTMLREIVQKQADSLGALSRRIACIERPEPGCPPVKPSVVNYNTQVMPPENTINVDVGLGASSTYTRSTDALVPTASIFIKPNAWPVEFFATGGIRPYSSSNICSRADVIGTIGAQVHIAGPVFTSLGGYTDREMCRNGGSKTNERFLTRNNGVFAGLGIKLPMIGAIRPMVNVAPTYSWTTRVQNPTYINGVLTQNQLDTKGLGVMTNITFRLDGNWNKKH